MRTTRHTLVAALVGIAIAGLDKGEVTDRVINVVKNFNKVDPAKVRPSAHR